MTDLDSLGSEFPDEIVERDWPEPTLDALIPPQAPYPDCLPPVLAIAVDALYRLAGAPASMAATCLLSSLAGTAQYDYALQGIAPGRLPLSLFAICSAPTGQHKSTVGRLVMQPYEDADERSERHWEQVKKSWSAMAPDYRKQNPDQQPAPRSPQVLRGDATIQALYRRLAGGRRAQVQYLSEIISVTGGWSGKKDQRAKTYHDFASIWDGARVHIDRTSEDTEITIHGRYLTTLYMGQDRPVLDWIMDPMAANGYSPRILLSFQTDLPELPPDLSRDEKAQSLRDLDGINRIIAETLHQQNDGIELSSYQHPPRATASLDLTSHALMRGHYEESHLLGVTAHVSHDLLMAGWHNRATEHAQRLAALLGVLRAYQTTGRGHDITIQEHEARAGIALADWYGDELRRVGDLAMANEEASDALEAWRSIGSAALSRSGMVADVDGILIGNIRRILSQNHRTFRNDFTRRDIAIARLETEGLLERVPRKKAQWLIHPKA